MYGGWNTQRKDWKELREKVSDSKGDRYVETSLVVVWSLAVSKTNKNVTTKNATIDRIKTIYKILYKDVKFNISNNNNEDIDWRNFEINKHTGIE